MHITVKPKPRSHKRQRSPSRDNNGLDGHSFLPKEFDLAHQLCYEHHDVLVELLRTGELGRAFEYRFDILDSEPPPSGPGGEILNFLINTGRTKDYAHAVRNLAFPALLSDLLHFLYEALQCSRKGKTTVAYALLRKPIQENLYLMEEIALDVDIFAERLTTSPMKLRQKNAGGIDGHEKRIASLLDAMGDTDLFDASYLAQLRYDKGEDGFDGVCNLAMHLFTEHERIRTENQNINFIFTGDEERWTQWAYLYTRLPYLICYIRRLVEFVFSKINSQTGPEYLLDVERRMQAGTLLWWLDMPDDYRNRELYRFVTVSRWRLRAACRQAGYSAPRLRHLHRLHDEGAFPDEPKSAVKTRLRRYERNSFKR